MNNVLKAVCVAIAALLMVTACDDPGKSGKGKRVAVWSDGETDRKSVV
jgi:hypothetical protein